MKAIMMALMMAAALASGVQAQLDSPITPSRNACSIALDSSTSVVQACLTTNISLAFQSGNASVVADVCASGGCRDLLVEAVGGVLQACVVDGAIIAEAANITTSETLENLITLTRVVNSGLCLVADGVFCYANVARQADPTAGTVPPSLTVMGDTTMVTPLLGRTTRDSDADSASMAVARLCNDPCYRSLLRVLSESSESVMVLSNNVELLCVRNAGRSCLPEAISLGLVDFGRNSIETSGGFEGDFYNYSALLCRECPRKYVATAASLARSNERPDNGDVRRGELLDQLCTLGDDRMTFCGDIVSQAVVLPEVNNLLSCASMNFTEDSSCSSNCSDEITAFAANAGCCGTLLGDYVIGPRINIGPLNNTVPERFCGVNFNDTCPQIADTVNLAISLINVDHDYFDAETEEVCDLIQNDVAAWFGTIPDKVLCDNTSQLGVAQVDISAAVAYVQVTSNIAAADNMDDITTASFNNLNNLAIEGRVDPFSTVSGTVRLQEVDGGTTPIPTTPGDGFPFDSSGALPSTLPEVVVLAVMAVLASTMVM